MRRAFLVLLCAVAGCAPSLDFTGIEVEQASARFLHMPETIETVLNQPIRSDEKKRALIHEFKETCTEPLASALTAWVNSTSLDSGDYPDAIESIRSNGAVPRSGIVDVSGDSATAVYEVETTEVFSLASNLPSVDDLFARYPISNLTKNEVHEILSGQVVPELAEFSVTSEKRLTIQLHRVASQWKVSQVALEPREATLAVRMAE